MKVASDDWLAPFLNRPCYRISGLSVEDADVLRNHLEADRVAFSWTKIPLRDVAALDVATKAGGTVADVAITLRCEAADVDVPSPADVEILEIPSQLEHLDAHHERLTKQVAAIAAASFSTSRFHADPRISREIADTIKQAWATASMHAKRGEGVLVAKRNGDAIGFLAMLGGDVPTIDLVAVAEDERSNGVGAALVNAFFSKHAGRTVQVGTQAANDGSVRFYERQGFRFHEATAAVHFHGDHP